MQAHAVRTKIEKIQNRKQQVLKPQATSSKILNARHYFQTRHTLQLPPESS